MEVGKYTIQEIQNQTRGGVHKTTTLTGTLEDLTKYFRSKLLAGNAISKQIPLNPDTIRDLVNYLNTSSILRGNKFSYELFNTMSERVSSPITSDQDSLLTTSCLQLDELAKKVAPQVQLCIKEVLTSDEVAQYMGISKSYLYKLTMRGDIPHYKPTGKVCYFNRDEIERWMQSNKIERNDL